MKKFYFTLFFIILIPINSYSFEIFDKLFDRKKIYHCIYDDGSSNYLLISNKIVITDYEEKGFWTVHEIKSQDELLIYAEKIEESFGKQNIFSKLTFNKISNELKTQTIGFSPMSQKCNLKED